MNAIELYNQRYACHWGKIHAEPTKDLGLVVVIPCFEEPDLIRTLSSLYQNHACQRSVEVVVVINQSISADEKTDILNRRTFLEATAWADQRNSDKLAFYIRFVNDIPEKHAGVGMARKIGMDEAVRRLWESGNSESGVIVCLDADCVVENNYLQSIEAHFINHKNSPACNIYFEHQKADSPKGQLAIDQYELHLRYYVQALRQANFPYAYHTVGSSMACRVDAYVRQGGMNRRKAGEDFYFLHKLIPLGNFTEIRQTCVYPSPRPSHRVPFSTGRAVNKMLTKNDQEFATYHWQSFADLKLFFDLVPEFYRVSTGELSQIVFKLPKSMQAFLEAQNGISLIADIKQKTKKYDTFYKAFFSAFNAFIVLKWVHFARDHFYEDQPVCLAARQLCGLTLDLSLSQVLQHYRQLDRKG